MASVTVLPICPCLYRGFLWVWCHYDIIQGERNVQNCTTSYWSVSFTQMSHMTLLLFWLTVIGQEGHMTKFKSHCSFHLKCPHHVVLFDWYKGIPCYLISYLCVKGLKCPLYYKNGIARGWITTKIGVLGVYHSWTTSLETWIILAKNAAWLLFILFSLKLKCAWKKYHWTHLILVHRRLIWLKEIMKMCLLRNIYKMRTPSQT